MNKRFSRVVRVLCVFICAAGILTGCGSSNEKEAANGRLIITDSIGRTVTLSRAAQKVAVANAYNAELINAIGALDRVVGVDYNIYQDQTGFHNQFQKNQVIGKDQRNINYEKVIELAPDVLILTGNGSWKEAEERLKPFGIPVLVCDAYYTDQFFENVKMLGQLMGMEANAENLADHFEKPLNYIDKQLKDVPRRSVYFEYRTAGNTTIPGDYFSQMVDKAHADNIFKDAPAVKINIEDVVTKNPEYIVKISDAQVYSSSVPPTEEDMERIGAEIRERPGWDEIRAVKENHILLLSHYVHGGASKLIGTMYLAKFMYPEYLPDLNPEDIFKTWVSMYRQVEYHEGHTSPAFALTDHANE